MSLRLSLVFSNSSKESTSTFYGEGLVAWPAPSPVLSGDQTADAVVIGGGFTGLCTAIELAKAGKKVVLCEAKKISESPSGRSGGQVIPGYDAFIDEIEKNYGREAAEHVWRDEEEARARLRARVETEATGCDIKPGIVVAAMTQEHMSTAVDSVNILKDYGYDQVELLDKEGMKQYMRSDKYVGGFVYKDAFHINPEKYLRLLLETAKEAGVIIAENSPVTDYTENADGTYKVRTPSGSVTAANAVFACGAEFLRPKGLDYNTLERTFVKSTTVILATEELPDSVLKAAIPGEAAWFDMRENMNYVRVFGNRILYGGVDVFMQVEVKGAVKDLEKEMYETLPSLKSAGVKVEKYWTGPIDASKNLLPSIRRLKKGLYDASGFSGHGLVITSLAGEAISEDIMTGHSPRLDHLAVIAPEPFNRNGWVAKLEIAKEHGKMITESLKKQFG